jgi:hypothetical protein
MLFELNDVIICLEQWEPHPLTFQSLPDYVESLFEVLTYSVREVEAVLIDHGYPVTDDKYDLQEPNDTIDTPSALRPLTAPFGETGLVMAEADPGMGDWYTIHVPRYSEEGDHVRYPLNVRVKFDEQYGDLDLVVRVLQDGYLRRLGVDIQRGGDSALTHFVLDSAFEYDLLIGVYGHGALGDDGLPTAYGGDFHPDYNLQIMPGVPLPEYEPGQTVNTAVLISFDPNEKVGPAGVGDERFVAPDARMPYTIYFENDPHQATAAAQKVVITDQLDADLNWSSFQFQQIRFGEVAITVPEGRLHYETDVTVSYDDYPVHVIADFDPGTGLVRWEMYSYDEMTGAAPRDPLAGFLPVNNELRQGEGFVTYLVEPQGTLATGSEIRNWASIVFDVNEPIITDETLHTIDAGAPTSHVLALPSTTRNLSFTVRWIGSDDALGSGIRSYDVFVLQDGGSAEAWLRGVTAMSATFSGEVGHTYAFYSVAIDQVGHRESAPTAADAQTAVVANPWHNYADPYDVNGQDGATALDVLIIINYINAHPDDASLPAAPALPPPYYDVTNDGLCTANDVLQVINDINAHLPEPGAESENADVAQVAHGTNGDGWFVEPTIIRSYVKMTESFLGSGSRHLRVSSRADSATRRPPTHRAMAPAARSSKTPFKLKPLFGTERELAEFLLNIETILPDIAEDIHDAWCFA